MTNKIYREVVQYLGVALGAFFLALSYSWFLVPYKIAPGGVGGLAQIFFHFFGFPVGVSMVLMNIPLFILSILILGKGFGVRSIYGMLLAAFFTDFLSFKTLFKIGLVKDLAPFTHVVKGQTIYAIFSPEDMLLSAIAGSVILGVGLGIIFRSKGSTAGTDIPVAIIKQKAGLSVGTGFLIVETVIIFTIGLVFKDLKLVVWGYVNLFISSRVVDISSEGLPNLKGVYIISDKSMEIRTKIHSQLERGVTFLKGEGAYTGKDYKIVFCVVSLRQLPVIREIVRDIDPKSFMIITEVSDVTGEGFKSRNIDFTT
jgi:uncharacterized membrane-anchored protein YitT (DUF2179 family)